MLKTPFTSEHRQIVTRLVGMRLQRGWSQRDLADRLWVPQSVVEKIESCERKLELVEYVIVCKAMQISPDEESSVVRDIVATSALASLA